MEKDSSRFLKPLKRIKVENCAAELTKCKIKHLQLKPNSEGIKDVFTRLLVFVAQRSILDLPHFLSLSITKLRMALALLYGTPVKTQKAKLLHKLEDLQDPNHNLDNINFTHHIFDGRLLLHSILATTPSETTYSFVARNILSSVCYGTSSYIYVCFDHYTNFSIKQCERELRGVDDRVYVISGPNQVLKQKGSQLLKNSNFKEELVKFLMQKWKKDHYINFLKEKTVFVSHPGIYY